MLESKRVHYGFLESLEKKYETGGTRSLAEQARLETLLNAHDECVKRFAVAIRDLGASDSTARDRLVELVSNLDITPGSTH